MCCISISFNQMMLYFVDIIIYEYIYIRSVYLILYYSFKMTFFFVFSTGSDPVIFLIQIVSPVYVIANVIVSAKETRILHLYQPASFLLLYILTNMAHCLATGSRVYALLNWTGSPVITIAISLGILLVFTPLLHMFVYGLFRLRTYLIDAYRELLENGDDVI